MRDQISRVIDDAAMTALTGHPVPQMGQSERDALLIRSAEYEKKRPLGPMKPLTGRMAEHKRWDAWEWFDETGALTASCIDKGLRMGPPVAWKNGIDANNGEHQLKLLQLLPKKFSFLLIHSLATSNQK